MERLYCYQGVCEGIVNSPKRDGTPRILMKLSNRHGGQYEKLSLMATGPLAEYIKGTSANEELSDEYWVRKDFYYDERENLVFYIIRSTWCDEAGEPVKIVAVDPYLSEPQLHIWGPKEFIYQIDHSAMGKVEKQSFLDWMDEMEYTTSPI